MVLLPYLTRLKRNLDCCKDMVLTPYSTYSNLSYFTQEMKDMKVLIVCGGPSALELDGKKLQEYDEIWSMNYFYKHPLLSKRRIDLCMTSWQVIQRDDDLYHFKNYLKKYPCLVGFEDNETLFTMTPKVNAFYQPHMKFGMHTAIYNQLGVGIRMLIFACDLGAKQVDFIGMDGAKAILHGKHGFETGKTELPTGGGVNRQTATHIFQQQYDSTWRYILLNFPDVQIHNIAKEPNVSHRVLHDAIRN